MFKELLKKIKSAPLLTISGLLVLVALSIWFYPSSKNADKQSTVETMPQVQGVSHSPSPEIKTTDAKQTLPKQNSKTTSSQSPNPTPAQKTISQTSQQTNNSSNQNTTQAATQSPSPSPTPNTNQENISVNLSVNGSGVGSVSLQKGNNQCDVLSKALEQGKISSLNMKFDNNYGSNAVYQINGIGNPSSVWWGYKVNGQSPSKGCSYVTANDGENIEWEYVGS